MMFIFSSLAYHIYYSTFFSTISSLFVLVYFSFKNSFNFIQKLQFHLKTSFSFKNVSFIERSYFHSKILFLFKKSSFHSKKLFLLKNLIFIQKICFHSITFHFVYAEVTGQLRDHMIPTRKPREQQCTCMVAYSCRSEKLIE